MRITGEEIEEEARKWLGTPFHHQGRTLGVAVDCAGVPVGIAKAKGLRPDFVDRLDYAPIPNGELDDILDENLIRVRDIQERRTGDILVFAWGKRIQHLGILTASGSVIHAFSLHNHGKVVETTLAGPLLRSLRRVYRFPEAV